jgi:hypothetical protein
MLYIVEVKRIKKFIIQSLKEHSIYNDLLHYKLCREVIPKVEEYIHIIDKRMKRKN